MVSDVEGDFVGLSPFTLWNLMLSLSGQCQNGVELYVGRPWCQRTACWWCGGETPPVTLCK